MPIKRVHNTFCDELWEGYIDALKRSGSYSAAAAAVNVARAAMVRYRQENPEFQDLCDDALEAYKDNIVAAAHTRAVDGFDRPIIGGRNRDEIVATERVYSDGLMRMFLVRADETFKDKREVTVNGNVGVRQMFDWSTLSKRARTKLRELIMIIKEDAANAAVEAGNKNLEDVYGD